MEIKAELQYPYTLVEKSNFIVQQSHINNYEVRYVERELGNGKTVQDIQALGYTEEEKITQRKINFESEFLETSLGCYRLQPQGYSNAQESFNTINNNVTIDGELTDEIATMVVFYTKPNFSKPEECTEEWLKQHKYNIEPMTKEQWESYYKEFSKAYAIKMYRGNY